MDWLNAIRLIPRHRVLVEHEPETDRYARARQKLQYIIKVGRLVGTKSTSETVKELAVWAPSNSSGRSGYYACIRVFHKDDEVLYAILYCLYDGTDGAPSVTSASSARLLARSEGFLEENENAPPD